MAQGFDLRHLSRYAQAPVVSCSACAPCCLPAVPFCCSCPFSLPPLLSRSFSCCLFLAWRLVKKDGFGDKRMRSRRLVVKLVAFGE